MVQTDSGVLLAFAEARIDTCADCAELGIAMRRSEDGGELKRLFIYSNKFELSLIFLPPMLPDQIT